MFFIPLKKNHISSHWSIISKDWFYQIYFANENNFLGYFKHFSNKSIIKLKWNDSCYFTLLLFILSCIHFRWDYKNKYYYDAINHLIHLKDMEKIKNIGLTNFDTAHLADLLEEGAPLVSNQVENDPLFFSFQFFFFLFLFHIT